MNDNRAMSKTESSDIRTGQDSKMEQSAQSSSDKFPNLTLLESGQNPGEILRAAREKAGLSRSDISAQTKINERQLEAIESGDISRLPPETFAKAFIKSYCRALKIDAAPVIASFGFQEAQFNGAAARSASSDGSRAEPFEPKMPSSSKRLSSLNFDRKGGKKSLSYGIVLAAVVVMAVFYIPVFMSNQNAEVVETDVVEPLPNEAPVALVEGVEPGAAQGAVEGPVDSATLASTTEAASQNPAGDSNAAAVFPALQQGGAPNRDSTASGSAAQGTSGNAAAPAASTTPTVASTPAVAPGAGVLRFDFQDQSWVTVRDANDNVLHSQLNDAGTKIEITGQEPFKLIVGNAQTVKLNHNGKPVDLGPSIRGEVARLTVQ